MPMITGAERQLLDQHTVIANELNRVTRELAERGIESEMIEVNDVGGQSLDTLKLVVGLRPRAYMMRHWANIHRALAGK